MGQINLRIESIIRITELLKEADELEIFEEISRQIPPSRKSTEPNLRKSRKDHISDRRKARQALGKCRLCELPLLKNSVGLCEYHFIRRSLKQSEPSLIGEALNRLAHQLQEKLQLQEFKCAYSAQPLVLGLNASVDHLTPVSRGGITTIENLQWVTKQINSRKRNLTDEEFRKEIY